ncbi:hypothetical protein A7975_06860 [Bacillus sp. FJAT-26390]|nr:hypothetical protein A7975_06860 [Bacillus sp. FJAT-26390]
MFITKLNAAGTALIYSTYLGGSSYDHAQGIAIDASGNAYVTGNTTSTNFPLTSGALQSSLNGGSDALVYSTYYGENGFDSGRAIAVDSSGNAYVTGYTESTTFPLSADAYQTSLGGQRLRELLVQLELREKQEQMELRDRQGLAELLEQQEQWALGERPEQQAQQALQVLRA